MKRRTVAAMQLNVLAVMVPNAVAATQPKAMAAQSQEQRHLISEVSE